jgi:hypothetical protein
MSHFPVIVIGNKPETQLAPYHEFECTGHNDKYVQDIDITEECRADFAKNHKGKETFAEFLKRWNDLQIISGTKPDIDNEHKFGYAVANRHGEIVKVVRRTNPNARWDWFQLGGRWTGYWKLKGAGEFVRDAKIGEPGLMTSVAKPGHADVARKRDIDFEGMRAEARIKAMEFYDHVEAATRGCNTNLKTWEQCEAKHPHDHEKVRTAFWRQPFIKAISSDPWLSDRCFMMEPEFVLMLAEGRQRYVQSQMDSAISSFAVVKDSVWYERGKMGWFAVVTKQKLKADWNREFNKLLDSLPENTLMSVYDCHI